MKDLMTEDRIWDLSGTQEQIDYVAEKWPHKKQEWIRTEKGWLLITHANGHSFFSTFLNEDRKRPFWECGNPKAPSGRYFYHEPPRDFSEEEIEKAMEIVNA